MMATDLGHQTRKQGRPRVTNGRHQCSRCKRMANQHRVSWPGEKLCNSCHYTAMQTRGDCPLCENSGILPGRDHLTGRPVCPTCAGIPTTISCRRCDAQGAVYRLGICVRCALREDLTALMIDHADDRPTMTRLVDILCDVDRPASIMTWKRSTRVHLLLAGLADGRIPLTHDGLDGAGTYQQTRHLRSILEHHLLLPPRDEPLIRFEHWLAEKVGAIEDPAVRAPIEQFATWHHLRRLRAVSRPGRSSDAGIRNARQDVTEAIKFLTWLHAVHQRTAANCRQQDVDEWLASGASTRTKIRTFLTWARRTRLTRTGAPSNRQPLPASALTHEERLSWIKELLTGDSSTLAHRVAGILVLLYAQPLTKIAALTTSAVVTDDDGETRILLGEEAIPLPKPFAIMMNEHLAARPNMRTVGAGGPANPWLFPSQNPGHHLAPQRVMSRLRQLGINVRASKNTALQSLVAEVPAPLVAQMLGYSHPTTQLHAALAATTWARYVASDKAISASQPDAEGQVLVRSRHSPVL